VRAHADEEFRTADTAGEDHDPHADIISHGYDRTSVRVSGRRCEIGLRWADLTQPAVRETSVTSPPQPVPGEGKSAGQYLRPLRDLAVYALVGATAVWLFVAIIRLIPDGPDQFASRTQDSFYGFVNLQTIFFPLAGVLLALVVPPRHPKARLIVLAALAEYAVAAFFGLFFGVLIGLINHAANNGARVAFEELLVRVAWLAVFAIAAFALYQIWQNMFHTPRPPKPVAHPGVYGQPQYGAPGAYPGQPGYGPPPGTMPPGTMPPGTMPPGTMPPGTMPPGTMPPGTMPPGYAPAPGSPPPAGAPQGGPPPGTYGQPQQPPAWNQQPPAWNQPVSGVPGSAPPPPGDSVSEPTQVVSQHQPPEQYGPEPTDRTQKIDEIRPGFGPADQDPPRG
jgi:hypothetical protein